MSKGVFDFEYYTKKLLSQRIGADIEALRETACMSAEMRELYVLVEIADLWFPKLFGKVMSDKIKKTIQLFGWAGWVRGELTHLGLRTATVEKEYDLKELLTASASESPESEG